MAVVVEMWSAMPALLSDEPKFDFAREGVLDLPDGRWCIDESLDPAVRQGVEAPFDAGSCGVRVTVYNFSRVLDQYRQAQAGPDHLFLDAVEAIRRLGPEEAERYRLQLWPLRRVGRSG